LASSPCLPAIDVEEGAPARLVASKGRFAALLELEAAG
jgi:hypothetical protein